MSLPIPDITQILNEHKVPADQVRAIVADLARVEAEKKEEKAADGPKAKNEYNVILLDPEHRLDGLGDFTALVVQVPENDDAGQTLPKLYRSVYNQRAAAKRRIRPIATVGEAAAGLKRGFTKDNNIHIKTKEPVRVLVSDNTIPAA